MLVNTNYLAIQGSQYVMQINPSTLAGESWLGDFLPSQVWTSIERGSPLFCFERAETVPECRSSGFGSDAYRHIYV